MFKYKAFMVKSLLLLSTSKLLHNFTSACRPKQFISALVVVISYLYLSQIATIVPYFSSLSNTVIDLKSFVFFNKNNKRKLYTFDKNFTRKNKK